MAEIAMFPRPLFVAIIGTAGVGKTTLALHWAHQIRHCFPDGQLYVNLRGFDHTGTEVDSGEVLRGFLHALGVPPDQIPASLDAWAARYRSVLNASTGAPQRRLDPVRVGARVLVGRHASLHLLRSQRDHRYSSYPKSPRRVLIELAQQSGRAGSRGVGRR